MRRFLLQIALFWALQGFILAALLTLAVHRTDHYLAASRDKEHRLATLPGRRVVLVGGSNVAFGFDSAIVERWTGRGCINMGLHAGLGLEFMLNEVRAGLHPGDTVVLCLEHYDYYYPPNANGEGIDWGEMARANPLALRYAPLAALCSRRRPSKTLMTGLSQIAHTALDPRGLEKMGIYVRHNFNERGDMGALRQRTAELPPVPGLGVGCDPEVCARTLPLLEAFVSECHRRGIAVYQIMPVMPQTSYQKQVSVLTQIEAVLQQSVSAPLLVTSAEAAMPDERFYDTNYHLTTAAARERSELLGRRLAMALQNAKGDPDAAPLASRGDRWPLR